MKRVFGKGIAASRPTRAAAALLAVILSGVLLLGLGVMALF
ncbi:hypothetical protein [Ruegeria sp. PrR005]|nr:hypothetical protein [Ruegeria sp. PrR005]